MKIQYIIILSFASIIFAGALLLMLPWSHNGSLTLIDALFTSVSAVCVTGLIVVDTGSKFTFFGQLIILILIQLGGIGIISVSSFAILLLTGKFSIKDKLLFQETVSQYPIRNFARILKITIFFVFVIEILGFIFLSIGFLKYFPIKEALWAGLFHSISAFCNAGFSIFSDSLIKFQGDIYINFIVMFLIIIGGIGFLVIIDILRYFKNRTKISLHSKIVLITSLFLIFIGFTLIFLTEYNHSLKKLEWSKKLFIPLFQSVTARTAGFNSIDLVKINLPGILALMILMFIGGSPGSTAGGIKTTTIFVLFNYLIVMLKNKNKLECFKRNILHINVRKAFTLFLMSLFIIIAGIFFIGIIQNNNNLLEIAFEVISAFATVGLSLGLTNKLYFLSKIIIIFLMFIGRLGPILIAMSIVHKEDKIKYELPDENILIG